MISSAPKARKHPPKRHAIRPGRGNRAWPPRLLPSFAKKQDVTPLVSCAFLPRPGPLLHARYHHHATISGFKGLEADVIILVDINPNDPRCDRSALYVAASRARHRLFVLGQGERDREAINLPGTSHELLE